MKPISALLEMFYRDARVSFIVFWGILLSIFALSVGLLFFLLGGTVQIGGGPSIYIFALVIGIITVKETFAYAIGMSSTRRHYYSALVLHFGLLSAALSIMHAALSKLEASISGSMLDDKLTFFTMLPLHDRSWLFLLWFHFIVPFGLLAWGNMLGCLHYRFGKIAMFSMLAGGLLLVTFISLSGGWPTVWEWLQRIDSLMKFTGVWTLSAAAAFALGWLAVRRASVRS